MRYLFISLVTVIGMSLVIGTPVQAQDKKPVQAGPDPMAAPTRALAGREPAKDPMLRDRVATAVALNYCRASFHRIRDNPIKPVMLEEQNKILNNLNLSGIADEEVIKLYSAVLDEIHQIELAEKERKTLDARHKQEFHRRIFANALLFGSEVATAQFVGAVRTGANSWWDYRAMESRRELEIWKVDKTRLTTVVNKSTTFLDTFWKMAKKKQIPDEWLVRGNDLTRLEQARRLPDLGRRLRVLRRMQRFMEYYPPYWYYVGRTQQELGQLFAAVATYKRMADISRGHFRNDEMLAAGLANQAAIQAHLGQPASEITAQRALEHSTACWQANLVCSHILARGGHHAEAEDAILRNLDVALERHRSLVHLLSLYYQAGDNVKLAEQLADPRVCRDVPVPVLLHCATRLGNGRLPPALVTQLGRSLIVIPHRQFGPDDLLVVADSGWNLQDARLTLSLNGKPLTVRPRLIKDREWRVARFVGVAEFGNPLSQRPAPPRTSLTLIYPDTPAIHLALGTTIVPLDKPSEGPKAVEQPMRPVGRPGLRITAIEFDKTHLSLIAASEN